MKVYLDISEFIQRPQRSGIQRVVAQICDNWPDTSELIPVVLTADSRLRSLGHTGRLQVSAWMNSSDGLAQMQEDGTGHYVEFSGDDKLLVPELFYEKGRTEFYRHLDGEVMRRVYCLVYDLVPLTRPELFDLASIQDIIWSFFRLLPHFGHRAFISAATRRDYYCRLLRSREGTEPVLTLGADTFARDAQHSHPESENSPTRSFLVLGTIETKKAADEVLRAFVEVMALHRNIRVTFAGRLSPGLEGAFVSAYHRFPDRLEILKDVEDHVVASRLKSATAVVFASTAEGFGLPPLESLYVGVPVIVSRGLPSLEGMGSRGIVTIDEPRSDAIREAILRFLDAGFCQQKAAEARQLRLKTWREFTEGIACWVEHSGALPVATPPKKRTL